MEPSSSSLKHIKVESKPMDAGLNFEALRWLPTFVDKSMLIRCVMNDRAHRVLLTAPPRFGKTMACSMLETFFQIVNSEQGELEEKYKLFEDLGIYKCSEKCTDNHDCETKRFFRKHCGKHPVISLDFGVLCRMPYSDFFECLRNMITRQFEKYMCLIRMGDDKTYSWSSNNMGIQDVKRFLHYLKAADDDDHWKEAKDRNTAKVYILDAFRYLIKVVSLYYQTKTSGKIIMLIDEFDAPFMKLLFSDHLDNRIITLIRDLMRLLCKEEISAKFVYRVMIFSVTELGGMFSLGANNVVRRTFLDKVYGYYKFFGFTNEEVIALVERIVTESERQKVLNEIRIWYNYTVIEDKDVAICNPMSITEYLPGLVRISYWSENVGTKYVCKLFEFEKMREKVLPAVSNNQTISIETTQLDDIYTVKKLHDSISNCINQEQVDLALQFLTERGYFNVIHKYGLTWTLQIPNQELKAIFTDILHKALLSEN